METEGGSIVLEIVFGSSAQGSLRAAQNYGRGSALEPLWGLGFCIEMGKRLPLRSWRRRESRQRNGSARLGKRVLLSGGRRRTFSALILP